MLEVVAVIASFIFKPCGNPLISFAVGG